MENVKKESLEKMRSKNTILSNIKGFLDKLDDDISEIYEELYKNKVGINTIISLLIKKGVFTEKDLKEETVIIRKRVRDK